jgi:hypothetical protein
MNKTAIYIAAIAVVVSLGSCRGDSDMAYMQQLQDSVFAAYPGKIGAVHINPEDRENLILVLGAPGMYALSDDERQKEAVAVGAMALRIFGEGNFLKTGRLVFTKDVKNTLDAPADGLVSDMKIDSLKKASGGK